VISLFQHFGRVFGDASSAQPSASKRFAPIDEHFVDASKGKFGKSPAELAGDRPMYACIMRILP
jgi:hypothetical protein